MKVLVTGGAGFIGSHFVDLMMYEGHDVVVLDKLTYAGRRENLQQWDSNPRFEFVVGDVCEDLLVLTLAGDCDAIVHMAAQTHVDRSLGEFIAVKEFIDTEVVGMLSVLHACKELGIRVLNVGTDEVYGQVLEGFATEEDPLQPRNPYSVCKAAAEMMCHSYFVSFGVDVVTARSCNNVGPRQHPEKLVPKMITNALRGEKLPVYGQGKQKREWIYVTDNCHALKRVLESGEAGEVYNVSACQEAENIDMVHSILRALGKGDDLIEFVTDRPGHDFRYAVSPEKLMKLGWQAKFGIKEALDMTVKWYQDNEWWWGGE